MSGLMNRLKNWVTGDDFDEDIYSIDTEFEPEATMYQPPSHQEDVTMERATRRQRSLKVVEAPHAQSSQVMVIEPKAFEDSLDIVEHLRAKKSVILNLHLLDTAQSQRVVDFLSGATHAIDGNQQRIGDGVFIFTPNTVSIATEQPKAAQAMDFGIEGFWKHTR